jgi:hypothetical protein
MESHTIFLRSQTDYLIVFAYEFLGTLLLTISMNFGLGEPDVIAAGIFIAVILTFKITGSHFGAGISIGIYILEGKWIENLKILFTYLIG